MISLKDKHIVIGIAGARQVGKSLVAERFKYNAELVFSAPIYLIECGETIKLHLANLTGGSVTVIENNKNNKVMRRILESLGRLYIEEEGTLLVVDYIKSCLKCSPSVFIISGVRRKEEVDFIHSLDGVVYHVRRDTGLEVLETERALETATMDFPIWNKSSIKMLYLDIDDLFYNLIYSTCIEALTTCEP